MVGIDPPPFAYIAATKTDDTGHYHFPALAADRYQVAFRDATGQYRNVVLQEAGTIEGAVRRIDGQAVPELVALAILLDDQSYNRFTFTTVPIDPVDGHYRLTGLYPGNYHICLATNYPLSSVDTTKCYGGTGSPLWFDDGLAVPVAPGKTVETIDILWGSDYEQYLPVVTR